MTSWNKLPLTFSEALRKASLLQTGFMSLSPSALCLLGLRMRPNIYPSSSVSSLKLNFLDSDLAPIRGQIENWIYSLGKNPGGESRFIELERCEKLCGFSITFLPYFHGELKSNSNCLQDERESLAYSHTFPHFCRLISWKLSHPPFGT